MLHCRSRKKNIFIRFAFIYWGIYYIRVYSHQENIVFFFNLEFVWIHRAKTIYLVLVDPEDNATPTCSHASHTCIFEYYHYATSYLHSKQASNIWVCLVLLLYLFLLFPKLVQNWKQLPPAFTCCGGGQLRKNYLVAIFKKRQHQLFHNLQLTAIFFQKPQLNQIHL